MRIFTVVCRRDDTPDVKYVRFLLETDRDYRLNSKKLHNLALELTSTQFGASASAAGVIYAVLPLLVYLYCKGSLQQGISLVDAPAGGAK